MGLASVLFLTLMWTASASAETSESFGSCPPPPGAPPEYGIFCQEEAHQLATEAAEESAPVTAVRAIVRAHRRDSYKHPGFSTVEIVATPLNAPASISVSDSQTGTKLQWAPNEVEANEVEQPWECTRPRETFVYTLVAAGLTGAPVSAQVKFHSPLTAAWCAGAKKREAATKRRARELADKRYAEEVRRTQENERISAQTERERYDRELAEFTYNCRELGGAVVWLEGVDGPICRGPNGPLFVPGTYPGL